MLTNAAAAAYAFEAKHQDDRWWCCLTSICVAGAALQGDSLRGPQDTLQHAKVSAATLATTITACFNSYK